MKWNIAYYLHKYRFKSVYTRLIIVFSIILAGVVLAVGGFSYIRASQSIKEKVNEANLQTLRQMQQVMDAAMKKTDTIISNLSMHYLMQKDYNRLSLSEKLELPTMVSSQMTETYIDSIYVYYLESGKALSAPGGAVDASVLPDTGWLDIYDDAAPLGFRKLLINHRVIDKVGAKVDAITVMREFPLMSLPKVGVIVINLDRTKLFSVIQQNMPADQNLFVTDANGELLSGDTDYFALLSRQNDFFNVIKSDSGYGQIDINGESKMISCVRSPYNGWMYVKAEDVAYLTAATKGIRDLTVWLMLLCLGGGMAVWAIVSLNFYKPILEVLNRIGGRDIAADDEYRVLSKAVDDIMVQKSNIEDLYDNSRQEIKSGLLISLCSGYIDDMEHVFRQLDAIGFPYQHCGFAVAIVSTDRFSDAAYIRNTGAIAIMKAAIRDIVESISVPGVHAVAGNMDENRIIALMSFHGDENAVISAAKAMQQDIEDRLGISATISIGNAYERITDIHLSYREALDALNYKVLTGNGSLIHINNFSISGDVPKYYYPMDKEIEMINAIKVGDRLAAMNVIDEVYDGIPKCAGMASYISEMLWQLMNGVFRGMGTMGMSYEDVFDRSFFETYKDYRSIEDIDGMRTFIEERVNALIDYIDKKHSSKNNAIVEAVKAHIEKHYSEDLSLDDVASKVYMSTSYMSTLFKEVTGHNFTDYVIGVRMSKAKELLVSDDKDINAIAGMVGYNNMRSFLRAFKRCTGMTPTEYRKSNAVDKLADDIR
ncbi:helix-turn-helix domain-containing protein [Mahella australiensis]|uniref:Transcriptional regulator, AraC family n=1 Tax=Mahella australiensis (strain DSM 15567 / CIP 107919 / 50-1 BON) TaxID=697281 RepID=F3ZWT1_MAHA5|nr:helix-turn-helix domain-containing protein [Mahella australiensis]AEE96524.1 transcriptional regulator, AraC family [Mahella australiensis 50-1 BON]